MPAHELRGIHNQYDLGSLRTRFPLSIEPVRIEPEEHLAIEQAIPLCRSQIHETTPKSLCRHRLLITNVDPAGEFRVVGTMVLFIPVTCVFRQCRQIEKCGGTEQSVELDRGPVRGFGQMVDVHRELQCLRAPLMKTFGIRIETILTCSTRERLEAIP